MKSNRLVFIVLLAIPIVTGGIWTASSICSRNRSIPLDKVPVESLASPSQSQTDGEDEQDAVSFQFVGYLPYDQQYDIEITSLVQSWGGLKCMVAQITSDEERAEFNKTFSKYGVEIPNHNFEESFLLVSGEAEIDSIRGDINGEQKAIDVSIAFDPESMPINNLVLYICDKVYLAEASTYPYDQHEG